MKMIMLASLVAAPVAATEFVNPVDADMRRPHICGFVRCWYTDRPAAKLLVKPPQLPDGLQPPGAMVQPRSDAFTQAR
jgi:hypothetical protein